MYNRLFIFDLDGTLLNTIGDLAVGCDHMLSLRGLPTHTYEEYCSFVGNGIMRLVERALPEELRTADYIKSARRDFVDFYIEHIDAHTVPYEGMVELINLLQQRGAKLAVASNKFQAGTEKLIKKFFPAIEWVEICGNREGVPRHGTCRYDSRKGWHRARRLRDDWRLGGGYTDGTQCWHQVGRRELGIPFARGVGGERSRLYSRQRR